MSERTQSSVSFCVFFFYDCCMLIVLFGFGYCVCCCSDCYSVTMSPLNFIWEAMCAGSALQSTTTFADEKERERVYDTIFRLPWRCELVI